MKTACLAQGSSINIRSRTCWVPFWLAWQPSGPHSLAGFAGPAGFCRWPAFSLLPDPLPLPASLQELAFFGVGLSVTGLELGLGGVGWPGSISWLWRPGCLQFAGHGSLFFSGFELSTATKASNAISFKAGASGAAAARPGLAGNVACDGHLIPSNWGPLSWLRHRATGGGAPAAPCIEHARLPRLSLLGRPSPGFRCLPKPGTYAFPSPRTSENKGPGILNEFEIRPSNCPTQAGQQHHLPAPSHHRKLQYPAHL